MAERRLDLKNLWGPPRVIASANVLRIGCIRGSLMRAPRACSIEGAELSELGTRGSGAGRPPRRGRDPAASHRWAWLRQQPEAIETVVANAELSEPSDKEEWLKRGARLKFERTSRVPHCFDGRMSEGRKPVWVFMWIQRRLSAFSPLDSDAVRTAREACDRAGERELHWYGRRGFAASARSTVGSR